MIIKLKDLLMEGAKENAALDYLKNLIKKSPYEGKVFLAGGAVRDELMGIDAKDLDFVINMKIGGIKFANWATKKMKNHKRGSNQKLEVVHWKMMWNVGTSQPIVCSRICQRVKYLI